MYHMTIDTNGTEDVISIIAPDGRCMMSMEFWNEATSEQLTRINEDAKLIVNALNAYKPPLFEQVCVVVREHDKTMNVNEKTA